MADLGTDRLTWRRLRVLLTHLPPESSYACAVGGEEARWGLPERLLALTVDALQIGNWQRQGDKNKPRPEPVPRPWMEATKRRTRLTPKQMEARLRDLQRRAERRRR